ncbi:hypothetical protein GCM10009760_10780 [Kitasatospora kazusensis]|uniref:DarT domain-containing protein n=1 Tax=Kitasatospora kazusensis TaxID=407974 RepID=A0ABN2YXV3_9ACTN
MMDTDDPWLFHFTHVDNLAGVLTAGLIADSDKPAGVVECADLSIKERRRHLKVPLDPGGVVADYAPFYFAPRSPMLFRIHKGGVASYPRGQTELAYLVTRLSQVQAHGLPWVATDRNAAVATAQYTDQASDLATHIDWEVMAAHMWANTPTDGSRRERRMAELLVHGCLPWTAVVGIGTHSSTVEAAVQVLLQGQPHQPRVDVRPTWYF